MALAKDAAAIDVWAEIAQNTMREGAVFDVEPNYATTILIDVALTDATAHDGSIVHVLTASIDDAAHEDEFWSQWHQFIGPTGTNNLEVITNNPLAIGGTTITMASTVGYETYGENMWRFLEDKVAFANSELVFQINHDANVDIDILDGVTRAHTNTAVLNSIARTYPVQLPIGTLQAKIVYNNKFDSGGATIGTRARRVNVTGI